MSYEVTTYNVGQGLFNLVIEVNDEGVSFCGIFDCGSIYYHPIIDKQAVLDDAACKIRWVGGLNCIVISHQDLDHWSWLIELLEKLYVFNFDYNIWYMSDKSRYTYKKNKLENLNIFTRDRYWYDRKSGIQRLNYTSGYGNENYMIMIHYIQSENLASLKIKIELESNEALDIAVNTEIVNGDYLPEFVIKSRDGLYAEYNGTADDVINILKQYVGEWADGMLLSDMMAPGIDKVLEAIWKNVLNLNIGGCICHLGDAWIPYVYIRPPRKLK